MEWKNFQHVLGNFTALQIHLVPHQCYPQSPVSGLPFFSFNITNIILSDVKKRYTEVMKTETKTKNNCVYERKYKRECGDELSYDDCINMINLATDHLRTNRWK